MISTFLKENREGKKNSIERFLKHLMEEKVRIQVLSEPYERTEERKRAQEQIENREAENSGRGAGTQEIAYTLISFLNKGIIGIFKGEVSHGIHHP